MKRYIFFFLLMPILSQIWSQEHYHYRYDDGVYQTEGRFLHEIDDSYVCMGREFNESNPYSLGAFAYEISKTSGKILNFTYYEVDSTALFFDYSNHTYQIGSKIYFLSGSVDIIFLSSYNIDTKEVKIENTLLTDIVSQTIFIGDFIKKDDKFYIYSTTTTLDSELDIYIYIYDVSTKKLVHVLLERPGGKCSQAIWV